MSEEIERIIKECSGVDTFDYVITPQQRDTMRLAEYIKELQQENQQLKERINTYENPEDLTLMFMYCDEKAKDKIKQYKSVLDEIREYIKYNATSNYFDADTNMFRREVDILQILDKVKE